MTRITRNGANWIDPVAPQTPWQRDRERSTLLPMEGMTPRGKFWSYVAVCLVSVLMWAAVFCWVLS